MSSMRRREFLKSASAAAASLAPIVAVQTTAEKEASSRSAAGQELRIGTARYAERDYPIQPKDFAEVTLEDGFWKPKILTNAAIPNYARYNRPSTSSGRPEPVEGRNPPTSIVWMRER